MPLAAPHADRRSRSLSLPRTSGFVTLRAAPADACVHSSLPVNLDRLNHERSVSPIVSPAAAPPKGAAAPALSHRHRPKKKLMWGTLIIHRACARRRGGYSKTSPLCDGSLSQSLVRAGPCFPRARGEAAPRGGESRALASPGL